MINDIKQGLKDANITAVDIFKFAYVICITASALMLGFICFMEGLF